MKHISAFIFSLVFSSILLSQNVTLNEVGQLNDILSEPSGIEVIYNPNNGHFEYWAHNDYENPEVIYNFRADDLMNMRRELNIPEPFIDWEDITTDEDNNLYLGDFGNWVSEDQLQILKIPNPNNYNGDPPSVEVIKFEYSFTQQNIVEDIEAMFHLDEFLYIFTKSVDANSSNPTRTYCFKIPDSPNPNGNPHVAQLISSFQVVLPTDADSTKVRVTAADISPDKKTMVLQSYSRIWVFSCFEGDDFFNGTIDTIPIQFRQYEGITFINNHEVMIIKEGNIEDPDFNPKVYHLDIHPWIDGDCLHCDKTINGGFENPNLAWSLFKFGEGEASLDVNNGIAEIDISNVSTNLWHINIRHKSLILEKGKAYQISYTAYAENDRPISVIANKADGSLGYFYAAQDITTIPTMYSHEFVMEEETDYNSFLSMNVGKEIAHKVFFDDISLTELECTNQIVSTKEELVEENLHIFPNPFIDQINIQSNGNFTYQIFDSLGKLLDSGNIDRAYIKTSQFQPGLYFLVLSNGDSQSKSSHKLIKL